MQWVSPTRNVPQPEVHSTPNQEVLQASAAEEVMLLVEDALHRRPGGDDILEEHKSDKTLKDASRRRL